MFDVIRKDDRTRDIALKESQPEGRNNTQRTLRETSNFGSSCQPFGGRTFRPIAVNRDPVLPEGRTCGMAAPHQLRGRQTAEQEPGRGKRGLAENDRRVDVPNRRRTAPGRRSNPLGRSCCRTPTPEARGVVRAIYTQRPVSSEHRTRLWGRARSPLSFDPPPVSASDS